VAIKFNPLSLEGLDITGSGGTFAIGSTPVAGSVGNSILTTDGSSILDEKVLTDGQVLIGSTGNEPVPATLTGTTNQVNIVSAPGSITLSTPQDIHTGATPTFNRLTLNNATNQLALSSGVNQVTLNSATSAAARTYTIPDVGAASDFVMTTAAQNISGSKTFTSTQNFTAATGIDVSTRADIANLILASSSIDVEGTAGTDVLSIGALSADVINIGNPASIVNIQGSVNNIATTNLNVTDSLITINDGGPIASGGGSGIEVEEAAVITGYAKVSSDRLKWSFKAPASAGILEVEPPAAGTLTINQALFDSKANISLNNLASTAVNVDILPNADDSIRLGSSALRYRDLYVDHVRSNGTSSINVTNGVLNDTTGIKLNWSNGHLNDTLSVRSIDWQSRRLVNAADQIIIDYSGTQADFNSKRLTNLADPTLNQDAATKAYVDTTVNANTIPVNTFTGAQSATNASVTGFTVANTNKAFFGVVAVSVDATLDLFEEFEIRGIRRASGWVISVSSVGDNSNVTFDMNSSGQLVYSSGSYPGFVGLSMAYRGWITP
jgi:hypothetical protein